MPTLQNQRSNIKYQNDRLKFKKNLFTFLFIVLLFAFCILHLSKALAQDTSCDLCGWCGSEVADKPTDWENCMKCLFPSTRRPADKKPSTNEYYPSHPEAKKNWTVVGCLDTAPGGFVIQIYKVIVSVAAGFALLAFIYGGFVVLTAGGSPEKVSGGKNIIMGAIFGLLLVLFSVFLLRLIGFEIIKIPGFGG